VAEEVVGQLEHRREVADVEAWVHHHRLPRHTRLPLCRWSMSAGGGPPSPDQAAGEGEEGRGAPPAWPPSHSMRCRRREWSGGEGRGPLRPARGGKAELQRSGKSAEAEKAGPRRRTSSSTREICRRASSCTSSLTPCRPPLPSPPCHRLLFRPSLSSDFTSKGIEGPPVGELVGFSGKRLNAFASLCAVGNKIFCVAKATTVREAKPPNASIFCHLLLDSA
jgi:hypothetical protein